MNQPLRVYGYHGTNTEIAAVIIQRGFNISSNDYDWLGTGVYFFQDAPLRAWQWANQRYPENPAVIRSLIRLENCIYLFDIGYASLLFCFFHFSFNYHSRLLSALLAIAVTLLLIIVLTP